MVWQGEAKRASLCGGKMMATQRVPRGSSGWKYKKKNMKHSSNDGSTETDMVFAELGAVELLRQDCRPSFIVDLMMEEENFELTVVFSNDAFKTYAGFREVASWLSGNSCQSGEAFIKWIHTQPRIAANQYWFRQQRWSKVLLEDRWCVVSGHEMAFAKSTREDTIHSQSLQSRPAQGRSFDLGGSGYETPFPFNQDHVSIQKAPGSFNPAMAAYAYFTPSPLSFETPFASFFCSKDWSSTALESISEQLLHMTSLISNFTQLSPIAMFIMDAKDGSLLFANEAWTRITGGTVEEHTKLKWLDCIVDEDREFIADQWREITVNKRPIRNQGRLKTLWKPAVPDPALFGKNEVYYTWAECNAVPLFDKNGDVEHVVGCLTDITHLKWAARIQERRAKEALNETRQREDFIKMTSHELMNPLSAVVQCADTIISSLDEINKALSTTHDNVLHDDNSKSYGEIKTSILRNIEIAKIILGCGEHQKRIIDDARKMKKSNIDLFSISPIRAEPIRMVDTAMTMLSGETSKLEISVQLKIDPSMETLDANWLCFDPSRFLQLLLNLLTNANKYTESSETRRVVVCLGATTGSPYHKEIGRDIQYIPLRTARNDPTLTDASGNGEIVYLHCSITDTGKGLSEKERSDLFKKLSETFLSTHTQCGDASLGLLISRELAELQGGAIGIGYMDSQATGSTFAFYIKTRRSGALGLDGGDLKPGVAGELTSLKGDVGKIEEDKDKDVDVGKDVLFDEDEDVFSLSDLDVSESDMTSSGKVVDVGLKRGREVNVDGEVERDRSVKEGEDCQVRKSRAKEQFSRISWKKGKRGSSVAQPRHLEFYM